MVRLALVGLVGFALATPAAATRGVPSRTLEGFKSEQVFAFAYRNPTEAIHADPRFEPEQHNPSIHIDWTRDGAGRLWADVIYRNPDTEIYREKNERFEFAQREDGDWNMVGSWSRWKCLGAESKEWTTEPCEA